MPIIAQTQKTIVDMTDPIQQGTAPVSPVEGTLWLDTSQTPPVLKRWSGAEWVVVNDLEIGGRNFLQGTSEEYAEITIGQYYTNVDNGVSFDTREHDMKAGDKLVLSLYVKVPDTAARGVRARITAYLPDMSSYAAVANGNVVQPGEEGYCVLYYTIVDGKPILRAGLQNANTSITDSMIVQVRRCKLEAGTKRTDWTPAPEDDEEKLELKLTETRAQISTTADGIRQEVAANYAPASDMANVRQQLTTLSEQTDTSFSWTVTQLNALSDSLSETQLTEEQVEIVQTYMQLSGGGLLLGKTGNPVTLRILNDRVAFYMNDTEVAYLSNNKLYVTQAEILTKLQIGKFAYEPQTNGNLSVIYTG